MERSHLVVLTEPVDHVATAMLEEVARLRVLNSPSEEELAAAVADADALFNRQHTNNITERVMRAGPRLQIVARHGVGYENVDLAAATRLGIVVTYTPGKNTEAMVEYTFTMLLALAKQYVQANQSVMSGEWDRDRFKGVELAGKTLGVIGLGQVGRKVIPIALAFGMRVIAYSPSVAPEVALQLGAEPRSSLDELLGEADVVTVHTALRPDTRGLIDEARLRMMKPSALIVNNARGPIIDEMALYRVLAEKRIGGAALDAFGIEPFPVDHPLRTLDNVVLTPHIATMTEETQRRTAVTAAVDICRVLNGEPPLHPLNPEVLRRAR